MQILQPQVAVGLMSGTSADGVDVVRLRTDGQGLVEFLGHFALGFPATLRARVVAAAKGNVPLNEVLRLERELTATYAEALVQSGFLTPDVAVVGCHGQTIRHLPAEGLTWQLGDANYLAEKICEHTGRPVPVVMDLRRRDMAAGGQGAPLVPLFHAALAGPATRPCALLNIGGVANITLLQGDTILAADCGPGMGLLDQLVQARTGAPFDADGALAAAGHVDDKLVARALHELEFFKRPFPKSADRYEFNVVLGWLEHHATPDALATLAALTVAGITRTLVALGPEVKTLFLCGGGPRNQAVRGGLAAAGLQVRAVEDLGWPSLAVEAGCFGWLAVRRLVGLPLSTPATTGAARATVGGVLTA